MHIGLQLVRFDGGAAEQRTQLARVARYAEQAGFYSLWALDHLFQMEGAGRAEDFMFEGYSLLNYLAALTETVKLGTLVTGVVYRHPGFLIKTVSTLDALSGGRAYFGIGAAWYEREALGLGIPFPPLKQRFEQLEETLQIAHQMWGGQGGSFHGQHYHLNELINQPSSLQQPHPPVLVGGMGEQKTLRFVAQYGDACNFDFGMADNGALQHKLNVLRQHCADVGRDYDSIEKTAVNGANLGDHGEGVDALLERAHQLAGMGFTHLIYNVKDVYSLKGLELFGSRIIPELAKI